MAKANDITIGQIFTRLTVIGIGQRNKWNNPTWKCRCKCGTVKDIPTGALNCGDTKSCGCLTREASSKRLMTHGKCGTRSWAAWKGMIARVKPASPFHEWYFDKGIRAAAELQNFEGFYSFLGECPERMTLDRIDSSQDYRAGNVRWATRKQQARNTSRNRLIQFNGKIQCLGEWAEELGIPYPTLHKRLRVGWSIERALMTP